MKLVKYMSPVFAAVLLHAASVSAEEPLMIPPLELDASAGGQPMQPEPQAMPPGAMEMMEIQMKLQEISTKLSMIQQQAFELQRVIDAFTEYEAQLRAKMVELQPEAEGDIDEAEALLAELRAVEDFESLPPEEMEALQAKFMQFQETVQRLQPVEQQASQDPSIQAAQEGLEEVVMSAMAEIDPNAEAMIQEQEELIERYMELEGQNQQLAPQAPMMMQP